MHDTQHQNVEGTVSKLPLGAVNREHPRFRNFHQCHNRLGNGSVIQLKVPKKPLQSFVMRICLGTAAKGGCEFTLS
jgi:hypothetical protein